MKKIYRVYAHDAVETDYPCHPVMYHIAENEEELRATLERDNEDVVFDWIVEVTLEEVVSQANFALMEN